MRQTRHIRSDQERDSFISKLKVYNFVQSPKTFTYTDYKEDKSRDQENKYHALIRDIARSQTFCGSLRSVEDWKRILMSAFRKDQNEQSEALPGLRNEVVMLGKLSTGELKSSEASDFIEFIYSEFPEQEWSEWSPIKP